MGLLTPPKLAFLSSSHLFMMLLPSSVDFTDPVKYPVCLFLMSYRSTTQKTASYIVVTTSSADMVAL